MINRPTSELAYGGATPQMRGAMALFIGTVLSWLIFQALPGLILSDIDSRIDFIPENHQILIFTAALALGAGYWLAVFSGKKKKHHLKKSIWFDSALPLARFAIYTTFPLTCIWALFSAAQLASGGYLAADPVSGPQNLLSYVVLSLLPIVLWSKRKESPSDYWGLIFMIVAPRLIISLVGPRFFVLQALIPIALWEIMFARKKIGAKLWLTGVLSIFCLFFLFPYLRGDETIGLQHLLLGSPILLWDTVAQLNLTKDGSEINLVACEIFSNISTLDICSLRSSWGIPDGISIRLDQAATYFLREATGITSVGTGGNPLIEAFPATTITWAGLGWLFAVGLCSGYVIIKAPSSPIYCYLLPHISSKIIFLWRGSIAEYFDRIPLIIISYLLLMTFIRIWMKCGKTRTCPKTL